MQTEVTGVTAQIVAVFLLYHSKQEQFDWHRNAFIEFLSEALGSSQQCLQGSISSYHLETQTLCQMGWVGKHIFIMLAQDISCSFQIAQRI